MRRQYGLYTINDALSAGWTHRTAGSLVASGVAERVTRGLYRDLSHPVTPHQLALAPCLELGGTASVSHDTALWLYGAALPRFSSLGVDVVVDEGSHRRSLLAHVHQMAGLATKDRRVVDGIPCLSPAVALLTLAWREDPRRLEKACVSLLCDRWVSADDVVDVVDRLGRSGRNGTVLLRKLAEGWAGRGRPDSGKEFELAEAMVRGGLPTPQFAVKVCDAHGTVVASGDVGYPEFKVIVDYHSDRHHWTAEERRRDAVRSRKVRRCGWEPVPATQDDIDDPTELVATVRYLAPDLG